MELDELGRGGWGGEGVVMGLLPLVGMLVPLLLLAGLAFLVLLLSRRAQPVGIGAGHTTPPMVPITEPALTILRDRYARGELDTADYEERRRRLSEEGESL